MKWLTGLVLILSLSAIHAQESSEFAGTASLIFLRTDMSPRTSSLGGSFTAIADDQNALYYNPAGLAHIRRGSVTLAHSAWFRDININHINVGYNFDRHLGIALGFAQLGMPDIQGKDRFGMPTEKLTVSSSLLNLGMGYRVHPSLFAGISVKYFYDNLAGFTANGMAADIGFYMDTMLPGISIGLAAQNIGGEIQYERQKEKIPFTYRAGIGYKPFSLPFKAAVDAFKSIDTDINYSFGLEYQPFRQLVLRTGSYSQNKEAFHPVYGIGLTYAENIFIDYAYISNRELGDIHQVGLTFRFDIPATNQNNSAYNQNKIVVLRPPEQIAYKIETQVMRISWERIPGVRYNVYGRSAEQKDWKKLNYAPLIANRMQFKRPTSNTVYTIVVTSVAGDRESDFSQEVVIHVP